jgi:hypothetical protein
VRTPGREKSSPGLRTRGKNWRNGNWRIAFREHGRALTEESVSAAIPVTIRQQSFGAKIFMCRGKNGGWSANTLENECWREGLTRPPPVLSAAQCKSVQISASSALIFHSNSTPFSRTGASGFASEPMNYTDFRGKGGGWRTRSRVEVPSRLRIGGREESDASTPSAHDLQVGAISR